jgi:CRP/FNR family cyclic AMP-dependent transcriptional regulator
MDAEAELADELARLGIFRDLSRAELGTLVRDLQVLTLRAGERIIRDEQDNANLYIIVDGEVAVFIDDEERSILSRGSFFGEVSALLGEPATADVLTRSQVRCLLIPAAQLETFLVSHPRIMFRMLQAEARRLRNADEVRT